MAKFFLPVTYQVYGVVEIEADTLEEAIDLFYIHPQEVELPYETELVDGSLELNGDTDHIRLINNSEQARRRDAT